MRKDKYACIKLNAIYRGKSAQKQLQWQLRELKIGELQKKNCKKRIMKGELQKMKSINDNRWQQSKMHSD